MAQGGGPAWERRGGGRFLVTFLVSSSGKTSSGVSDTGQPSFASIMASAEKVSIWKQYRPIWWDTPGAGSDPEGSGLGETGGEQQ